MEINATELTVRYSNTNQNDDDQDAALHHSNKSLINFLDQSLFKLKNVCEPEEEAVIYLGYKGENDSFFKNLESLPINHDSMSTNEFGDYLVPKKLRNRETNKVYWDMTEEKIEINDSKSDIVRTFFLVKILDIRKM